MKKTSFVISPAGEKHPLVSGMVIPAGWRDSAGRVLPVEMTTVQTGVASGDTQGPVEYYSTGYSMLPKGMDIGDGLEWLEAWQNEYDLTALLGQKPICGGVSVAEVLKRLVDAQKSCSSNKLLAAAVTGLLPLGGVLKFFRGGITVPIWVVSVVGGAEWQWDSTFSRAKPA